MAPREEDEEQRQSLSSAPAGSGGGGAGSGVSVQLERLASYTGRPSLFGICATRKRAVIVLVLVVLFAITVAVATGLGNVTGWSWGDEQQQQPAESEVEGDLFTTDLPAENDEIYGPKQECDPRAPRPAKGTYEYAMLAANCGLGYDYKNSTSKDTPWNVVLYGKNWYVQTTHYLSGCPLGAGQCPHSPKCVFTRTTDLSVAKKGDVVMMFQHDHKLVDDLVRDRNARKKQYRVLYYREAFWTYPPRQSQAKYDFQMGVHWQSAIWNPDFAVSPSKLYGGLDGYGFNKVPSSIPFLKANERPYFAISIISHCNAWSKRDMYIAALTDVLGANRVHRYGQCGDRTLPPPPIKNAAKLIAKYKFYLSFENMIQDGYMTEKLLTVLAMPIVPVYYGSRSLPNITTTPSFIKASDYAYPQRLAKYLLYLDKNPEEYERYHAWRSDPKSIHPQFLEMLAMKSPGYYETQPIRVMDKDKPEAEKRRPNRAAVCCRLCDENHILWAKSQPRTFYDVPLHSQDVMREFFGRK